MVLVENFLKLNIFLLEVFKDFLFHIVCFFRSILKAFLNGENKIKI